MNALKVIMQLIFIIGFIMIVVAITKVNTKCPPREIVYRYLPIDAGDSNDNPIE